MHWADATDTSDTNGTILSVKSLTFGYAPGEPVLRDVTLRVRAGAMLVVVGPNGAGKSTLIRRLAGLLPGQGVSLLGRSLSAWSISQRARHIGYVPQVPGVAFGFTVRDVVAFGLPDGVGAESSEGQRAVQSALEQLGLAMMASKAFAHLSAGQQQRSALARAIVRVTWPSGGTNQLRDRALLCDEPTSAQDPAQAIRTLRLLRSLAERGAGIVVIMHDLGLALRWADDAVVLSCDGRLAAAGEAKDVLTPSVLEPVFGVQFAFATTQEVGLEGGKAIRTLIALDVPPDLRLGAEVVSGRTPGNGALEHE